MTHTEYHKILVVVTIIGACFTLLSFYMLKSSPNQHPITPKSNFAVVDRYEDRCDVIQWTDNQMATYKYFLDCKDK